jgi:hypothetical protein
VGCAFPNCQGASGPIERLHGFHPRLRQTREPRSCMVICRDYPDEFRRSRSTVKSFAARPRLLICMIMHPSSCRHATGVSAQRSVPDRRLLLSRQNQSLRRQGLLGGYLAGSSAPLPTRIFAIALCGVLTLARPVPPGRGLDWGGSSGHQVSNFGGGASKFFWNTWDLRSRLGRNLGEAGCSHARFPSPHATVSHARLVATCFLPPTC